ncbi:MAG: serine/threonine-protein kinase [Thermoanaerobaculia bacterium]
MTKGDEEDPVARAAGFDALRWRRLSALLDGAFELPPAERAVFLLRQCADDPELAREADSILAVEASSGILDRPAIAVAADLLNAEAGTDSPPDRAGEIVGPYRLTALLGQGGMGAVYRAERIDGQFEQRVALKLIKRGMDSEEILRRFRGERQILARLQHESIARLYDGGVAADGTPWFAMEEVAGLPITEFAVRHALPLADRLALFAQVGAAVAFAHRNLVVHRDLKPSNVLAADSGKVKLLDFGIAKLLDPDVAGAIDAPEATRTAFRAMTPQYAAPEQLSGAPVTTSTDVFALGLLLQELLTGRRAERRETTARAGGAPRGGELVASPVVVARDLPKELRQILTRAMADEPDRRYASVEAFLEDLDRLRRGQPVLAHGDSMVYRLSKFVRRNRLAVAAGAAVLVALLAGLGAALWQARLARDEAIRATAARDFIVSLFQAARPAESHGEAVTAQQLLATGALRIEKELGTRPALAAELLETVAQVESELGETEDAGGLYEKALVFRRRLGDGQEEKIIDDLTSLGDNRLENGDVEGADKAIAESLSLSRQLHGEHDLQTVEALAILGSVRSTQGKFDEAEAIFRGTSRAFRDLVGEADPRYFSEVNSLAVLLLARRQPLAAEPLLRELLAWSLRYRAVDSPDIATGYHNLGNGLLQLDRVVESETNLRQALAIREKMLPPEHGFTVATMRALAQSLLEQRRIDEAVALGAEALRREVAARGGKSRAVAACERMLARVDVAKGDSAAARARLERVVPMLAEIAGADYPLTLAAATELAEVEVAAGDAKSAAASLGKIADRQRATNAPVLDLARTALVASKAALAGGHADEAINAATAALTAARPLLPESHSFLAATLLARARASAGRGAPSDRASAAADVAEAGRMLGAIAPAGALVGSELKNAELKNAELESSRIAQ